MRRKYEWAAGLIFLILLAACGRPSMHARELVTTTPPPASGPAPTATTIATRPSDPTPLKPFLVVAVLPTAISQAAPVPTPDVLPTIDSRSTPVPTPFPDTPGIVDTVLGTGAGEHWASYLVDGSFTARGADEQLALVGNIGDFNEVRWVVVGQGDEGVALRGTSACLGSGFDAPPSFNLPPDVLDFDRDGRQEVLSHSSKPREGWTRSIDTLYRWDGKALATIWEAPTAMGGTAVDTDVLPLYRVDYRAEWEWANLDSAGMDEILLRDQVMFYTPDEEGSIRDDAASAGEESGERAFRWDGAAFRPYAPDGPDGTFAYVAAGDAWLWQDHAARPLGAAHVQEMDWSPDGRQVVWWSQPPLESAVESATLGTYDLTTGVRREFSLNGGPPALRWAPDGRLGYTLPGQPPVLLDLESGQQEPLPVASLPAWSPEGGRLAYEEDGSLYVYDLTRGQAQALVESQEEGGAVAPEVTPDFAWSPRGDWIACRLSHHGATWAGLVAPDPAEPVRASDLVEAVDGWEATGLQLAWSPDGSQLAALATAPSPSQQPAGPGKTSTGLRRTLPSHSVEVSGEIAPSNNRTVLYLAEVPPGGTAPVGRPVWKEIWELETITRDARLSWSPDGQRLALAAGTGLWEVSAADEPKLRHRFSFPHPRWTTLEWAPDGSGILAGLESGRYGRLYWFPAGGGEPVLLLADTLGAARWAPGTPQAQARDQDLPPMVLVEYSRYKPLLHFVRGDGSETVVRANGASGYTPFQVSGQRVFYYRYYAERRRVYSIPVPDAPDRCQAPVASPDGEQLAWLCNDGPPDWQAMVDGTAEIHFRLILTDWRGRRAREVWQRVETGPTYRDIHPMGWSGDATTVYLSQPQYGVAWAYFEYNPGILAIDVNTSQATQIGDLGGVQDGRVSSDGAWLVQSRIANGPGAGISIALRSLVDGERRTFAAAPGTLAAGDFSFSPDDAWLAWREWAKEPAGSRFVIRALRLPQGEPFTVYEDEEDAAPRIGGWLGQDDLVLVYPLQKDGTGEYSTVLTLPATGPGYPLSPFVFVGVLDENP